MIDQSKIILKRSYLYITLIDRSQLSLNLSITKLKKKNHTQLGNNLAKKNLYSLQFYKNKKSRIWN
ncbi:hypothetical protein SAMN05444274_101536 [Mariniphaga anaerophila]|uniref:Uncharacterized protein n=1 Tax=Mariniphaga anaerophila TaxID=1484053 RepID=A0A1M4U162_9BACT|nr:hypothetical protein SAMN05444274_101536 [Mariniphaga anaerophila]